MFNLIKNLFVRFYNAYILQILSDVSDNTESIAENSNGVNRNEGEIASTKGRTSALESKMTTAEEGIATLGGDLSTVGNKVTTLEGEMDTVEGNVSNLSTGLTTANQNIATNATNIGTNTTEINGLKSALQSQQSGDFADFVEIPDNYDGGATAAVSGGKVTVRAAELLAGKAIGIYQLGLAQGGDFADAISNDGIVTLDLDGQNYQLDENDLGLNVKWNGTAVTSAVAVRRANLVFDENALFAAIQAGIAGNV